MASFINRKFFEPLLIALYLLVGFVPYLDAIDKIAPQYLYLSILNSIAAIYILFTSEKLVFKYASYVIASLFGLVFWSFLSLTHATNKAEVLNELVIGERIRDIVILDENRYLLYLEDTPSLGVLSLK